MRLFPLVIAPILSLALAAHADSISTFDVSGDTATSPDIGISGSFVLDTTNGQIQSNNLTVFQNGSSESLFDDETLAVVVSVPNSSSLSYAIQFGDFDTPGGSITLEFNQTNLIGYDGGNFCTTVSRCSNGTESSAEFGANFGDSVYNGAVTLYVPPPPPPPPPPTSPSAAPEPSSIFLLATGSLGLLAIMRKRYASAAQTL